MWQELVVYAVVALAGLYALWYWLPAGLRRRLGGVRPALGKAPSCGSCSKTVHTVLPYTAFRCSSL